MAERIAKWVKWLDVISHDVEGLLLSRGTFTAIQSVIQENSCLHQPSYFYSYFRDTYISHVGISLRRQIKNNADSISLARLLREISDSPELISREYFRSLYENTLEKPHLDSDYDFAIGSGLSHIDPSSVTADLDKLKAAAEAYESFVDRRIAHHDKRLPTSVPTYNQIHDAISLLDALCVKYNFLLTARSMDTLEPTHQDDWLRIFRIPWINSAP